MVSMEHEGAYLGAYEQALAARNNGGLVIAQVKRAAAAGSIPPQQVRVPGVLVDFIVLAPDQMQTTQTLYDPAISGEVRRPADSFAARVLSSNARPDHASRGRRPRGGR